MTSAVKVQGFSKTFRQGRKVVEAVRDIEFEVPAGQIVGFVGPNGAGKSTTIKALLGFLKPTLGTIEIFGKPAGSEAALKHIGFMPEHPSFPDTLTGMEWMEYAYRLHKRSKLDAKIAEELLDSVGLSHASGRFIRGYSKGMLQRLGLAQALVADPEVLILDEPLSGLDPMGRSAFKQLLQKQADRGAAIFFTSHILDDVENICERIILIDQGTVRVDQSTMELLDSESALFKLLVNSESEPELGSFAWGSEVETRSHGANLWELKGLPLQAVQDFAAKAGEMGCVIHAVDKQQLSLEELFVNIVEGD